MSGFLKAIVLTVLAACVFAQEDPIYKRLVCYFTRAGTGRAQPYDITPDDIDPFLCTHIVYGYVYINDKFNGIAAFDDTDRDYFSRLLKLRETNPRLSVLLGVTGDPASFRSVADNPVNREAFVREILTLLQVNNFDGVDLDWRFPEGADRTGFADLIKDIWSLFDFETSVGGKKRLLVSAVISATFDKFYNYDLLTLTSYLDILNLLSIGYEQPNNKTTLNTALRNPSNSPTDSLNQNWILRQLIISGVPAANINLGVATYARCYRLCSDLNQDVGASTCGDGEPGAYTKTAGRLAFYEVCENLKQGWKRDWSLDQLAPYAFQSNQWCSFDDVDSITYKVNFVNVYGIGGISVWDLSQDDIRGEACDGGKFPIVGGLNRMFNLPTYSGISKPIIPNVLPGQRPVQPVPMDPSVPVVTLSPIGAGIPGGPVQIEPSMLDPTAPGFQCKPNLTYYYANAKNCRKYFECKDGQLTTKDCPAGQKFKADINSCVFDSNMGC